MSEQMPCTPVPCPAFEEVELQVSEVCDCHDYAPPGHSECPIHGEDVSAWFDGWNAAVDLMNEALVQFEERRAAAELTDNHNFHKGWNTAIRGFENGVMSIADQAERVGKRP